MAEAPRHRHGGVLTGVIGTTLAAIGTEAAAMLRDRTCSGLFDIPSHYVMAREPKQSLFGASDASPGNSCSLLRRAGAIAFGEMDRKAFLYRVHSGALCLTSSQSAAVAFAFPGDLVGLGFLEDHTELATAVVDTTIECLPREAQQQLAAVDQRYRDHLDAATEKEFEHQRLRLSAAAANSPIVRVASYLVALSAMNMREGMDPHLVEEPSVPVASCLRVSADQLAHILSLFQTLDMIEPEGPNRLSLKELDSPRRMADASIGQVSGHKGALKSSSSGESPS